MSNISTKDVVVAIEEAFNPRWQEDFDNTGLQVGSLRRMCHGVMLCVDVTPEIVVEAADNDCNLIVSHHPLIFHPLRSIGNLGRVDMSIIKAIKNDVAIYSCHTSVDNAPVEGVSWEMARMLGLTDIESLEDRGSDHIGSGIVGNLPQPLDAMALVELVKSTFGSPIARCSNPQRALPTISRVALCGGAGSFLIPKAIDAGAQAFIASDCKHNTFLDFLGNIFLIDIGHYESEMCTKQIFAKVLRQKFPDLKVLMSKEETNPVIYI